jgi:hypothetical protein
MTRFTVVEAEHPVDARPRWAVVDSRSDLVVANFATREEAEAHARRLEEGPLDWEEQEAWQEEEWGDWEQWD